ncbi:hypothetical protein NUSPORA_02612 [Nucleospora cyclopteri]
MTERINKDETKENSLNNTFLNNSVPFNRYRENSIWAETTKTWEDCMIERSSTGKKLQSVLKAEETAVNCIDNSLLLENRNLKNTFVSKLMENTLKQYLIVFESGRTIIGISREEINIKTYVVVEADRGEDIGRVYEIKENNNLSHYYKEYKYESTKNYFISNHTYAEKKKILRLASKEEVKLLALRKQQEQMALDYINHIKDVYYVDMEITKCEYQWDSKRITFYYRSSKRIDFRELVKELFKHFKIRIWMCSENREFYK